MVSVFPASFRSPRANKLENLTLRGFGGGWNAVETDLQMESEYLVRIRNFRRTPGGTQKLRYGSRWLADLSDIITPELPPVEIDPVTGKPVLRPNSIVDMIYFSAHLICVIVTGEVVAIAGDGSKTVIWSSAVAGSLPDPATGWSDELDSVSFVPYKNELIIHNGIDKPITISRTLVVTYLQDLATGSNINVPIGKYGCVVSNYHVVGGIAATPNVIYVSSVGTSGTFPGDPDPNDAISEDIGAFAPQGAVEIRGLAGFRANLLVFFQDQTVIVKLGQYDAAGNHELFFPDTMPSFGILGHRCVVPVENDLLFAGLGGMASARRNLLSVSGTLESTTLSSRIEPAYREEIGNLTDEEQLKECFMVQDALSHDVLLFTPNGRVFVYSFDTKLKYSAWSEYDGLNVQCACRSFLGRVFYADGLRVFQHGNKVFENEEFFSDRTYDRDRTWGNATFFDAGTKAYDPTVDKVFIATAGHTSSVLPVTFAEDREEFGQWEEYLGEPISFDLELPWLDSKNPMTVKFLRFIAMATKGNAEFMVKAFVDNLYKNHEGEIIFSPALSMEFIANEAPGFGFDAGPYGGGRRSGDPRLFKFPVKFKILKIVVSGNKGGDLELVNMSFLFSRGKYKR